MIVALDFNSDAENLLMWVCTNCRETDEMSHLIGRGPRRWRPFIRLHKWLPFVSENRFYPDYLAFGQHECTVFISKLMPAWRGGRTYQCALKLLLYQLQNLMTSAQKKIVSCDSVKLTRQTKFFWYDNNMESVCSCFGRFHLVKLISE